MNESEIESSILQYLRFNGVMCWKDRQYAKKPTKGSLRSQNGTPDIIGILSDGKFLGIEVKKPGGKLSDEQKGFLERSYDLGAQTFVAYSLQDVINYFDKRGSF